MGSSASYMDQVIHKSGFLFVILLRFNNGWCLAHPKYDTLNSWIRVSNPTDPLRTNSLKIDNALPFGDKDYLIHLSDCTNHFCCMDEAQCLLTTESDDSHTRKSASKLISMISNIVGPKAVGVTGSLALHREKDGYSDIDLTIPVNQFELLFQSSLWNCDRLHLRTLDEWKKFYNRYGVLCASSSDEFAKLNISNRFQFLFDSIPVSLFVIPNCIELALISSLSFSSISPSTELTGHIIAADSFSVPGTMLLEQNDKAYLVVNCHRSYAGYFKTGDECRSKGLLIDNAVLIVLHDSDSFVMV